MKVDFDNKFVQQKCYALLQFDDEWKKAYGILQPHAYLGLYNSGFLERRPGAPIKKGAVKGQNEYRLSPKGVIMKKILKDIMGVA